MGDQKTNLLNADVGPRLVGQDIYEESATPKARLGARLVLGDRVFRYVKVGATAAVAGKIYQAPAPDAYDEDCAVAASAPIGSTTIALTINASHASTTANQYKDGYLIVGEGSGVIGATYKIKANTATTTGGAATMYVTLYDPIVEALTTSHKCAIVASPYNGIVLDAGTAALVGVPLIDITANYYGWVQTWGPCGVISGGAITAGKRLTNSSGTVVAIGGSANEVATPIVGTSLQAFDSGDCGGVFLTLSA